MRYFLFDMSKGDFRGVYTTDDLPDTELIPVELDLPFVFFGMRKFNALHFSGLYYVSEVEFSARIEDRNQTLKPEIVEKLRKNPVVIS